MSGGGTTVTSHSQPPGVLWYVPSHYYNQPAAVVCLYLQRSSRKVKFATAGGSKLSSSCGDSVTTETTQTDDDEHPQSSISSFSDGWSLHLAGIRLQTPRNIHIKPLKIQTDSDCSWRNLTWKHPHVYVCWCFCFTVQTYLLTAVVWIPNLSKVWCVCPFWAAVESSRTF